MATIRPRGKKYQVRWREGGVRGGQECSESFHKLADAVKFKGHIDANGQRAPEGWVKGYGFATPSTTPKGLTLAEWAPKAVAARQRPNARTKADTIRDITNHTPDWLGQKPMSAITHIDVGIWLNELREKGLSDKTIKNVHGMLSTCIRQAVKDHIVEENVFEGALTGVHMETPEIDVMTPAEMQRVLDATPAQWYDFVWFLWTTGARFSEATALAPRHVNVIGKSVRIEQAYKRQPKGGGFKIGTTKSNNKRDVPTSAAVTRMLARRAAEGGEHLFTNTVGNVIMHSNFYHAVWLPILDRADLGRRPRIHDIRHSHASFLLSSGVPMIVVSRRLGHASIKITVDRYGHILEEAQDRVRALLDAADMGPTQLREAE